MASLFAAKQIAKYLTAFVGVTGFTTAGGTSDTVTSALTTALSTASNSGGSVPLQVGNTASTEGIDTTTGFNETPIFVPSTNRQMVDANNPPNEVYGKITYAGSTWTLSYFSNVAGTETAFAMPASTSIAFQVPYVFTFGDWPARAATAASERSVAADPIAYGFRLQTDALTVTAPNTLSSLSQTPNGTSFEMTVNGQSFDIHDPVPVFSYSGKAMTWIPANAFPLATTDDVVVRYSY